jgi:hypothetical protein
MKEEDAFTTKTYFKTLKRLFLDSPSCHLRSFSIKNPLFFQRLICRISSLLIFLFFIMEFNKMSLT